MRTPKSFLCPDSVTPANPNVGSMASHDDGIDALNRYANGKMRRLIIISVAAGLATEGLIVGVMTAGDAFSSQPAEQIEHSTPGPQHPQIDPSVV